MPEYLKHEHAVSSLAGESCPSRSRGTACEEAVTESVPLHDQATRRIAPSVDTAYGWSLISCPSAFAPVGNLEAEEAEEVEDAQDASPILGALESRGAEDWGCAIENPAKRLLFSHSRTICHSYENVL